MLLNHGRCRPDKHACRLNGIYMQKMRRSSSFTGPLGSHSAPLFNPGYCWLSTENEQRKKPPLIQLMPLVTFFYINLDGHFPWHSDSAAHQCLHVWSAGSYSVSGTSVWVYCHVRFELTEKLTLEEVARSHTSEASTFMPSVLQGPLSGISWASLTLRQTKSKTTLPLRAARRYAISDRGYNCLSLVVKLPTVGKRN